jgi:deoxyribodipyrimidine photolyase-related protein
MSVRRHLLVLGDQLNRSVEPLATADPQGTTILMIESEEIAEGRPHHKQKLVLFFSAMRHFAEELRGAGFIVDYRRATSFAAGVREHLAASGATTLEVMDPADWGVRESLERAAGERGAELLVHANGLWLTSSTDFDVWAEGRKGLRLEYFYRDMRKRFGWLMEDGKPVGGMWNYDADNRQTPEPGHVFPGMRRFSPDALTRTVIDEVAARWPDHFGGLEGFSWPVTREEALAALDDFVEHRLPRFGPFEDAMVEGEAILYHSLLSVPLNLGLLHPREVCERALAHASVPEHGVPLPSIEGFLRQILGWREFIRHVYRRMMPDLRNANGLGHESPLPELYWGAPTRMRCLSETVRQLADTGHTHHIQRLMVLGNFALIAGVDPKELNDWFLTCYVDALDWVVTPNVMGMSQFADLGSFTSKPYAASGKYIDRMSDHCRRCVYDPRRTTGAGACPLNSLYWRFLDRHHDRFESNPRMAVIVRGWRKRDPSVRSEILEQAASVMDALRRGDL